MSDKIINSFQQRRQLNEAFANISETKTQAELLESVRQITREFPTDLVISTLMKHLDTKNSQMRGGLGHLSALLPPDEIIAALRSTVANRNLSTHLRLNSVSILERFLGETVSPSLLGDLQDTDEIAFQSLCEAVEEGHHNRYILLEYVTQMRDEDEAVAEIVLGQIQRLPEPDQIEMLRLIAQDDRLVVARMALNQLINLDYEKAGATLLRALHTLQFTLPPALAKQAERALRKHRFVGNLYTPADQTGWRALLSPAEASGNQLIWLLHASKNTPESCIYLSVVINIELGILQVYGNEHVELSAMPSSKAIGGLVTMASDSGEPIAYLEAPFDYARWLIQETLKTHWDGTAVQTLYGEYILYNDLIWQFEAPEIDDNLAHYFQPETDTQPNLKELEEAADSLLAHPSMISWIQAKQVVLKAIRKHLTLNFDDDIHEIATKILEDLAPWPDYQILITGLQNGLVLQAPWLEIAGSKQTATQTKLTMQSFDLLPPHRNPFLIQLFSHGLKGLV